VTASEQIGPLASRIIQVHELLDSMRVPHQFGGAIALAFYRTPRATTDIDLNITVPPSGAAPVLGALTHIGVAVTEADRTHVERDGQVRLDWGGTWLDLFFATLPMHLAFAAEARIVPFGPIPLPILAPEHLVVCKSIFGRPKDWIDVEAMVAWGTAMERQEVFRWVEELLGRDSAQYRRLDEILP
jgi:hypothetical protein